MHSAILTTTVVEAGEVRGTVGSGQACLLSLNSFPCRHCWKDGPAQGCIFFVLCSYAGLASPSALTPVASPFSNRQKSTTPVTKPLEGKE